MELCTVEVTKKRQYELTLKYKRNMELLNQDMCAYQGLECATCTYNYIPLLYWNLVNFWGEFTWKQEGVC